MKTLVKCKEQVIKCDYCGATYRLEKPKDFKKVKWSSIGYWGYSKCKICKQKICVKGAN